MRPSQHQLLAQFPNLEKNRPLAPLTTFNIGGPADLFYKLTDTQELAPLLEAARMQNLPTFILGGGSNTIFADEGFRGLVIHMSAKKIALEPASGSELAQDAQNQLLAAESGTLLSQVIQFALKNSLSGMEKMMGLPGTIGGAVRGNAGAFGTEISDLVDHVLVHTPEKGLHELSQKELQFGYRTSAVKHSPQTTVLKVWLKLAQATPEQAKNALAEATDIVKNRLSKQPKGKCSGSFFKNPPDNKAGYLLEQIGAKGMKKSGVQVSSEHANWLMNTGAATQKDVLELSQALQKAVKDRFGIDLEREVQLVSAQGHLL